MYQAESARILFKRDGADGASRVSAATVGRTVFLLGITSLLTDLSAEMVTTILPLYLVYSVGLSPLQFGVLDGLNNGAAGLVRLVGGGLGDRLGRHKAVASFGYGLSAATRPAYLLVGNVFSAIGGIVFLDRIGKGIRTAPRDAMISMSVSKEKLGLAFGVHRSLDTLGAMLGPLVSFAILSASPGSYNTVFVASFAVALIGLAVIVILVPSQHRPPAPGAAKVTVSAGAGLLRIPAFRGLVIAGGMLALATISDAFIYLRVQGELDFAPEFLPLLWVGSAAAYMLLAVPFGRLADRVGRGRVFLGGYVFLLLGYVLLIVAHSTLALLVLLGVIGAYYAATDGVLAAAASATLPEELRGTGLSILATWTNLGRFAASILFGAVWVATGPGDAVVVFACGLVVSLVVAAGVLRRVSGSV